MSKLDDAMEKYMEFLCVVEKRAFSYLDFQEFEVDGELSHMGHGTFRNKVSDLMKRGKIEWLCDSPQGFYILKGSGQNTIAITNDDHTVVIHNDHVFYKDKIMNQSSDLIDEIIRDDVLNEDETVHRKFENPRIITNNPLYRYVRSIPFGQRSIHDIRLNFKASGIWDKVFTSLSSHIDNYDIEGFNLQGLKIDSRSKDISFSPIRIDNLSINVRIHKTDRVSVIIACSYIPVILDADGIQRLSKALLLIQEGLTKLVSVIENSIVNVVAREKWNCPEVERRNVRAAGATSPMESTKYTITTPIPKFMDWTVNMWHFGADAIHEYSGEKFNCRWELARNIIASIYSKDWKVSGNGNNNNLNGHKSSVRSRIRVERQEYPRVSLDEALRNKCPEVMEVIEQ